MVILSFIYGYILFCSHLNRFHRLVPIPTRLLFVFECLWCDGNISFPTIILIYTKGVLQQTTATIVSLSISIYIFLFIVIFHCVSSISIPAGSFFILLYFISFLFHFISFYFLCLWMRSFGWCTMGNREQSLRKSSTNGSEDSIPVRTKIILYSQFHFALLFSFSSFPFSLLSFTVNLIIFAMSCCCGFCGRLLFPLTYSNITSTNWS